MNRNGATMANNTYRLIQSRTSLFPSHANAGPKHWGEPKASAVGLLR